MHQNDCCNHSDAFQVPWHWAKYACTGPYMLLLRFYLAAEKMGGFLVMKLRSMKQLYQQSNNVGQFGNPQQICTASSHSSYLSVGEGHLNHSNTFSMQAFLPPLPIFLLEGIAIWYNACSLHTWEVVLLSIFCTAWGKQECNITHNGYCELKW